MGQDLKYQPTISRDKNSLAHKVTRAIPGILMILVSSVLYYQVIYHPYNFYNVKSPFIFVFFYHLYITTFIAIFGLKGINLLKKTEERDFKKEYMDKINANYTLKYVPWDEVIHYVIVPNYKEHMSTLEEMLDYIAASTIAKTNIIPVLAMEEREKEATDKAKELVSKYSSSFMDILYTLHPPGIPGETPGKSSNESWAGKFVNEHVDSKGYNKDFIVITIADADSCLHKKYFENLTLNFCTDESSRYSKIWQAPVCNYKNFFDIPAAVNFTSFSFSLHELAHLTDVRDFHIPFSTYSMSLKLAQQAGGWDADIIPEDWHMYLKSFFATSGAVDVEPIYLPTLCYAVEGDTYWHTINDRYVQAKRHSWGICEISYFAYMFYDTFFKKPSGTKKPSIMKCFAIFFKMVLIHYTSSLFAGVLFANIIMTLTGKNYIGRYYPVFLVLYYIPQMSIVVVNYFYMRFLFPNRKNMEFTTVFLVLKWNALRDILFVIFYYTALDASLKQMFTDNFNYIVATKPVTKPKE